MGIGDQHAAPRVARRRAVFFDRDGTLNRARLSGGRLFPPRTLAEFELLPGVGEALARLKQAGYLLVVATNQPDVAKGLQTREVVEAMHGELGRRLPIDDIRVCYHVDADHCRCRKPQPGMLVEAAAAWGIDLATSYMVGDRWRDMDAGRAAGCRTIFIRNVSDERQPEQYDLAVESVLAASGAILDGRV